jgi:hypothetical protein
MPISSNFSSVSKQNFNSVLFYPITTLSVYIYLWLHAFPFLYFELQHPEIYARLFALVFTVVHEYSCQYVTPTCHFDTRNATHWMFNTVSKAWGYDHQARTACSRFKDLLDRYWRETLMCIGYWQVDYESESESLKLTRVACVPYAGRVEWWVRVWDNSRVN